MMDAASLRRTFVDFFAARGHTVVGAAPLVPRDDPTLLFNSAGMVQFKPFYSSADPLPYRRAVSVQPCLRAGGKDSDLENVGRTPRHLSFFEMLGNFSFGDYFKEEAIVWGWKLLTEGYRLDGDRLWISVYQDDDEAERIWREAVGISPNRIVRLGKKDNFWGPAGKSGACGPSSEIYYDLGPGYSGGRPGDEGDRFFELYNLVFPQFDMQEDGSLAPLANRGIDTGMGLERLALVVQGVETVFDTDLFIPLIERFGEIADIDPGTCDAERKRAIRIIADHVRGLTFAVAEGVMPSNEGRGYVLRRILRRAARRGWNIGVTGPFLHTLSGVVVDRYQSAYPLLRDARERVALAIHAEEERFETTLGVGIHRFEAAAEEAGRAPGGMLPGDTVFALYDTYGFPLDLIDEMAAERELGVDRAGFEAAMARQKARSRAAARFEEEREEAADWTVVSEGPSSEFTGYASTRESVRVRRFARRGEHLWVVLDRTPFYAESGGQVGDTGELTFGGTNLRVVDTIRRGGEIVHVVETRDAAASAAARPAPPRIGDPERIFDREGVAEIDAERRRDIQRNHTATHLLHAALRRTLGTHVTQAGSLVAPDRLRFDFTHFQPLTPAELEAIESAVGRQILRDVGVEVVRTSLTEALESGAMALFGEKYGDVVRQVVVPGFSRELCGGTHVRATGEIGPFIVTTETGVAAGTRRIEAMTGTAGLEALRRDRTLLRRVSERLQVPRGEIEEKLGAVLEERDRIQRELERVRTEQRREQLGEALAGIEDVDGLRLMVGRVDAKSAGDMRSAADHIRERIGSGIAILGADVGGKASFLVLVTSDLVESGRFRADQLVREVAAVAGGSGGGKPDLALAGAKEVGLLNEALEHGRKIVRERAAART
jgi:alanyl-tRNA synthetase